MDEVWKDIPGYEGYYQVSDSGRVRRVKPITNTWKGKILSFELTTGYPRVMLSRPGTRKHHLIHELVMLSFVGQRPRGHHINHKDGNKVNNHPDNLEYVTPKENDRHSREILGNHTKGEANGYSKLTKTQVIQIRKLYASGDFSQRKLASILNVSQRLIWNIVNHHAWKHVD